MNDKAPAPTAPDLSDLEREAADLDGAVDVNRAPEGDAPAAPEVSTAEVLRPLVRFTLDFFAPNWKVPDEESAQVADAYAAVLDKYFPDGVMSRWGVEINALLVTFVVFGPRLKIAPRDRPPEDDAPPSPGAAPTTASSVPSAPPASVQ